MIAGSDEVGKGDYFGYIVVACVCGDEDFLRTTGARDSKTLSKRQVFTIDKKIRENCVYSSVAVSPHKYNSLHKDTGGKYNLNQILGWMHSKAIINVFRKCQPSRVIVDKFGKEEHVLSNLPKEIRGTVSFVVKGERDPAVAAASVIARAEFLRKHAALSKTAGLSLPLGSAHVKEAAREFIEKYGKDALKDVAKVHFSITKEL